MSARFEVARTGAPKPWHFRVITNGNVVCSSQNYCRMVGAERGLLATARAFGLDVDGMRWNVDGKEKVLTQGGFYIANLPTVLYVEERAQVPADLDDVDALAAYARDEPLVNTWVKADKKIHAIKELRALTGASLYQSKVAVDALMPPIPGRW